MGTKSTSHSEIQEEAAGFVLYRADPVSGDRRFLVLRHRLGGHWAFPKGRLEPGESIEETARRELQEETGFERVVIIPGFREESRYCFERENRTISKCVTYLLGRVQDEAVELSAEHTECAWLSREEAVSRLTFSEARRILQVADLTAGRMQPGGGAGE